MSQGSQFAAFRFDAASGVLSVDGAPVDVGGRAAALLKRLLERRGEVVGKAALIEAAWGDAAIEESNLSVQIARLRRVIGGDWIETVGRVGYRFRPEPPAAGMQAERATLAVTGISAAEAADAALARGLGEDLRIALSRFGALAVMDAGGPAEHRLEGSLRRAGRGLRLNVWLTQAAGPVLWGERFDAVEFGRSADHFVDMIATRVESHLQQAERAAVGAGEPRTAAAMYQRGRALLLLSLPEANAQAMALFEQALEREPGNVAFLAAACDALALRISLGWPALGADDAARCDRLAHEGLRRGVADATLRTLFGYGLYRAGDRDSGHAVLQEAVERNHNSLVALTYAGTTSMHWGDLATAEAQYRRAIRLAPHDPSMAQAMGGLSRIRMMQGRFEDALRWAQGALRVNANYAGAHWSRVAASAQLGREDEARRHLGAFRASQPAVTIASIRAGQPSREARMAATLEGLEQAGLPTGR